MAGDDRDPGGQLLGQLKDLAGQLDRRERPGRAGVAAMLHWAHDEIGRLRHEVGVLRDRLGDDAVEGDWLDATGRSPESLLLVLACCPARHYFFAWRAGGAGWHDREGRMVDPPSHWQYLPSLPDFLADSEG